MNSARNANRGGRSYGGQASNNRGRGRGRGRGFNNCNTTSELGTVPTISQVVVGAPVSIVLKIDQPTGRQVQGFVADLLTRGNHPRGIKVRLRDGRVGRVQKMCEEATARAGSEGMSGLRRNGEGSGGVATSGNAFVAAPRYSDFRVDAPDEPASQGLSLEDYVVTKKVKGKGQPKKDRQATSTSHEESTTSNSDVASATSVCPVCGIFEGDEMAVAHHVNTHFD